MAGVLVKQAHALGRDGAMKKLGSFEELLNKYRVKLEWSGNRAKIKGIGVGGDVVVGDSDVVVNVELGLAAKLAGVDPGKLQHSISKRLQEALV